MKRQEKIFFVDNLTEELVNSSSIILVDHTGLSVKLQQDLNKKLKKAGAKMLIVKNTLFKLAGQKAKLPQESLSDQVLSGPNALIISEGDPIIPLQILSKFAKENELPNLKVGIIEKKFQDKDSLIKLAQLPSKEVLYSQLIGSLASPFYGIISVLKGNVQNLIYILEQKSKLK